MSTDPWRSMESAPRDGTRILLDCGWPAHWTEQCQFGQFAVRPGWQIFECEDVFYSFGEESPKWWMPLPAPPEGEQMTARYIPRSDTYRIRR